MKYLRLAGLCLLFVPPTNVRGDVVNGIDILSSVYSVDAPWNYTWHYATGDNAGQVYSSGSGNYGGSSSDGSPLSVRLTSAGPFPPGLEGIGPGVSGSTSIDRFSFHNSASAVGSTSHEGSDGRGYYVLGYVKPDAQATWTFCPTGDTIQVALHISNSTFYNGYSGLSLSLSDVSQNTVLLAFSESDTWHRDGVNRPTTDVTDLFSVSTSDTYELAVHGWANTFVDDYAYQNVTASIQVVPEPRAFGLCLLGLLSLAGYKKWPLGNPRR